MTTLSQTQIQSILDNYGTGKIVGVLMLESVQMKSKNVHLSRVLAETNQGLYLVVFAPNDELHGLWWGSEPSDFAATLSNALKLKNAKILQSSHGADTWHKYDLRISVFVL